MKSIIRAAALVAGFASCGFQIGCGGSNSGTPSSKPATPDSTVTSVTVVATPSAITTVQTSTCVATVNGTGSFSTGVTWTATGGTITPSGVFTPSGTGSGTCTAASAQTGYTSISGSGDITITKPPSSPQGVYSGTTSMGYAFQTIILPDSSLYALYGTITNNVFLVQGVLAGNGSYSGDNYSASGWDSDYVDLSTIYGFSANATFVAGSSISGTINDAESGKSSFTGTMLPTSSFNYATPAQLSDISGTWSGALLGGVPADATIQSNGSFSGTSQGCVFSGSMTPDPSGNNFFDITITYGAGCSLSGRTENGIAVDYLLSDGSTRQIVAALSGYSENLLIPNNVFIANK